jgi:hypothetical protein
MAHSSHIQFTGYHSKTYQQYTSKEQFGRPISHQQDTTHSQVHQKSWDVSHGTQLSLIQNMFVGWKFAGQNLQEAKDTDKHFGLLEKTLGWILPRKMLTITLEKHQVSTTTESQ